MSRGLNSENQVQYCVHRAEYCCSILDTIPGSLKTPRDSPSAVVEGSLDLHSPVSVSRVSSLVKFVPFVRTAAHDSLTMNRPGATSKSCSQPFSRSASQIPRDRLPTPPCVPHEIHDGVVAAMGRSA